ncbi:SusC/RagA family TonB-linked outer membrane protein [Butyricimonas virosa]|uniref:SusC/RagA family TonB-linked outer membrane protein n=2 Tax=Butyricimonas virosa TaxID=544645 RepID=UPI00242F2FAF|nr:SusC/RagA family TonB-linked outer membrane protein [Butyricimonas virosa]
MKKKRTKKRLTDELNVRRFLIKMKLPLFLLMILFLSVNTVAFSQTAKISVNFTETPLSEVFAELGKQAKMVFLYDHKLVESKGKVSLKADNQELEKVLKGFLPTLGLTYVFEDSVVVIRKAPVDCPLKAVRMITGVVTDETGQPLPGVHVVIKGSHKGVATDVNGKFNVAVEDGTKPVFVLSFVGMEPQELKVSEKDNYKVVLTAKLQKFDDVIVTGYQTISRERSAGSYSRVSGEEVSKKANLTGNILETLEGLTPGLSVNYGIGEDKFLIRGTTSINSSTEPLIVVDGVALEEGNIEELINSNDIESVTFLKDATSASIWGARAANGVIVITTKSGKTGDHRLKITYDGSFTYKGLPDFGYRGLMNSEQIIQSAKEIFDPEAYPWATVTTKNGGALVYPHEIPLYQYANGEIDEIERDRQLDALAKLNNRSQIEKYLLQPALFTKHTVSFSGAANNIYSIYGSVGYEYNQSIERTNTNKIMLNFKHNIQLKKWLKIDLTTNLSVQNVKTGLMPAYTNENTILPYEMLADEEGNPIDHSHTVFYKDYQDELETKSLLDLSYVPLDDMKEGFNKSKSVNGRVNLGIAINLIKGLKYEGRFQYQQNYSKSELFYSQNSSLVRIELARYTKPANPPSTTAPTYYLPTTGGRYTLANIDGMNWTIRNQFNYDRVFGKDKQQITAIAGMEIQSGVSTSNSNTRRGYDPQSQTYQAYDEKELATNGVSGAVYSNFGTPRNTLVTKMFSQSETEKRFVSFYSNVAYTYNSKYTLNGSIRVDQSNLYGSDPSVQFKPIWSVGVAWNLKRESFMDQIDFLNRLDFRFSYGLGGNSPKPGKGGPYNLLNAKASTMFAGLGIGYDIMYPANDKIHWERTRTINGGIDVAIFNNRITASIDVYHKLTTELLATKPTDQTLGWESFYTNFGDMKNQGFEVSLRTKNIFTRNFSWSTVLTMTNNRNKVLKLNLDGAMTAGKKVYMDYIEGYAGNSLFAYRWAGLSEEGNPQVYNAEGEIISDYQDESLTEDAVKFMGVTQPKWYGALTNNFSYKGFDFSFMLVYNFGHKMRRDVNNFWYGRLARNVSKKFLDRWREPGDEKYTDVPKYVSKTVENKTKSRDITFYELADINVLDASYVKLRDITLSYSLPKSLCDKLFMDRITLRAQASNLFLIAANNDGIDPEYHHYRSGLRGTKYGPSWSFGLTINFK